MPVKSSTEQQSQAWALKPGVGAFKSQPFHLLLVEFYEMSFGAGRSNFSICECGGTDREPRYHPQDCREESGSITYMWCANSQIPSKQWARAHSWGALQDWGACPPSPPCVGRTSRPRGPRCHQSCPLSPARSAVGKFFPPSQTGPWSAEQQLSNWHKQFQTIISEDKWLHLGIKIPPRGFPCLFMCSVASSHKWIRRTERSRLGRREGPVPTSTCCLTRFPWKLMLGLGVSGGKKLPFPPAGAHLSWETLWDTGEIENVGILHFFYTLENNLGPAFFFFHKVLKQT